MVSGGRIAKVIKSLVQYKPRWGSLASRNAGNLFEMVGLVLESTGGKSQALDLYYWWNHLTLLRPSN